MSAKTLQTQNGSGRLAGLLAATVAVLLGVMLLSAAPSRAAEPFEIEFDQSSLNVGAVGDLLGGLPLGDLATGASLNGTIEEDGTVNVPKGKFVLPKIGITDPIKIQVFLGVESAATGTYDRTTGALDLDAQAGLWISLDAAAILDMLGMDAGDLLGDLGGGLGGIAGPMITNTLKNLTCGFSPMDVHFTTGSNALASGAPFVDGPGGTGALTADWDQLGPFTGQTKILGLLDPCQLLIDFLPGLLEGGLGDTIPGGGDLGGLDLGGLLGGLNDLNFGPSSITLTRTLTTPDDNTPGGGDGDGPEHPGDGPDPKVQLKLGLKAQPVKGNNRPARFKVIVTNRSTAPARKAKICLNGFAIRKKCQQLGVLKAGASKARVLPARVIRKRLNQRRQNVLRPYFVITVQDAKPVRLRSRNVQIRIRGRR